MTIRRRELLQQSALALMLGSTVQPVWASQSNPKIKLGLIGCGGRAKGLVAGFKDQAEFSWVCDPDQKRGLDFQKLTGARHVTADMREILNDDSVQGVVIATPDHWHAPAGILAAEANKHVYVEKPCSHNYLEGIWLVEAARKNKVLMQHGTQSRSNQEIVNAIQLIREGIIGDVLVAKAWNIQRRDNIGKRQVSVPPPHVDYDTWVGPAEFVPFQSNRFHYSWHWWHNFGTGDIGNDGAHEIDIARWGLGVDGLPQSVTATGGKYYFDDDQQFPDTAECTFKWNSNTKPRQLIFEMRIWSTNSPYNCDSGVEFYGTKGKLMLSKRGVYQLWNQENQLIPLPASKTVQRMSASHQLNFVEAIRGETKLTADIQTGQDSVALIHLANLAIRSESNLKIDAKNPLLFTESHLQKMLKRQYRSEGHWGIPKGV